MNKLHLRTASSVYLEWLNNFLTTEYMSEYYDIPQDELITILNKGKIEHLNNLTKQELK